MKKEKIYHLNDRTIKYSSIAQVKRQHQYMNLPGEFKTRLPQEIVFPNMTSGRQDECYINNHGMIIGLEEESREITKKTLEKFSKYIIFRNYWHFPQGMYLGVICHKNPKKDFDIYKHGSSSQFVVFYHYISQDELWEKYENVINKVKQKEELTDTEALDMGFICKFISKKHAFQVIEAICHAFKDAIIPDRHLRMDVGVIIGAMILKNIENVNTKNRLLQVIDMKTCESEIQKLVYDEFGDELEQKDKEIEQKENELEQKDKEIEQKENEISKLTKTNNTYKNKIDQIKEIGDLNSPKAQEIIQSLMLL